MWKGSFPTMKNVPEIFGCMVFNEDVMRERLPKEVYKSLSRTMAQSTPIARANTTVFDQIKIGTKMAMATTAVITRFCIKPPSNRRLTRHRSGAVWNKRREWPHPRRRGKNRATAYR